MVKTVYELVEISMTPFILQVENLSKKFPVSSHLFSQSKNFIHALTDVSFDLKEGEVLGLVGESGCGKSTLGKLLLKLIEADSGKIIYKGQDITHFSTKQMRPLRQEIQMIFQDPFSSLNPRMTIGETLAEPLLIHRIVSAKQCTHKVAELLDLVGLKADAMKKYPHEFSGGQRQRIVIARALAVNPKLIIADEAVSALDVSIQAQIINLLIDLKEKLGLTIIFIAHDLKVVEHVSDRVCVMYLGKIMEIFSAKKIEDIKHPYTKSLISAVPIADPTFKKQRQILTGEIPSPLSPPSGCVFHTRCPKAIPPCSQNIPQLRDVSPEQKVACDVI